MYLKSLKVCSVFCLPLIFGGSTESILVNYSIMVVSTEEGLFSSVNIVKPAAVLSLLLDTFFRMN